MKARSSAEELIDETTVRAVDTGPSKPASIAFRAARLKSAMMPRISSLSKAAALDSPPFPTFPRRRVHLPDVAFKRYGRRHDGQFTVVKIGTRDPARWRD
jgi:hypothetical protein